MELLASVPLCVTCGCALHKNHVSAKYCSGRCKAKYRKAHGGGSLVNGHDCRECGNRINLLPGQGNKWLCSAVCRRARNARSVREFHTRRPQMENIYRSRTKAKRLPDNTNTRFYKNNPNAPKACESCSESRVVEVAHKPGYERIGERRTSLNTKWPNMVWVLCPTCHRLLDRMNYTSQELGLTL